MGSWRGGDLTALVLLFSWGGADPVKGAGSAEYLRTESVQARGVPVTHCGRDAVDSGTTEAFDPFSGVDRLVRRALLSGVRLETCPDRRGATPCMRRMN